MPKSQKNWFVNMLTFVKKEIKLEIIYKMFIKKPQY